MNGQPIPHIHGAPLRLIVPGWPGSLSQKWLTRITIRDRIHDGQGMGGTSYRVPQRPIVPGSNSNGADFVEMESMPVRSILSSHAHGTRLPAGTRSLDLRGAAWAGDNTVSAVHVSTDFGATWQAMQVAAPANRHAWQRWTGRVSLPSDGYYEVWYRATDSDGRMQPHTAANWNPQGYGANPVSRAAILVG
jgi:DMSO/TMAO reductase YedYZ molybdopterin-dependent catalytic subunit